MHKKLLKRILYGFGYKLSRARPSSHSHIPPTDPHVDLRHERNGLQAAAHHYREFGSRPGPVVINAPVNLGRGLYAYPFALAGESPTPFAFAVKRGLQSDNPLETIETILAAYVDRVQPCDALELLGLEKKDAPLFHSQSPLASRIRPWFGWAVAENTIEILQYVKYWESVCSHENQLHGLAQSYSQSGLPGHGIVSKERLRLDAQRLYTLAQSIHKDGYQRHDGQDGDIEATAFYSNGEWRWIVSGAGNHRASVLAALDKEWIPIRVTQIVAREDVEFWPNVRSGIYSEKGALKIFDSIFDAVLPPVMQKWEDFINVYPPHRDNELAWLQVSFIGNK